MDLLWWLVFKVQVMARNGSFDDKLGELTMAD
jgi:hypothetical protein